MLLASLFLLFVPLADGFKFLAFSPQFAVSHVNYIAKISDALVDAGHEVVIVAPKINPKISGAMTKKARVIEIPENEHSRRWAELEERMTDLYWNTSMITVAMEANQLMDAIVKATNVTINYPGLIDQLKAEKFDAAFSEKPEGFGIFHMVGIEKTALTVSFTNWECSYAMTQMASNPSYVPAILASFDDKMWFGQRLVNTIYSLGVGMMMSSFPSMLQPIFEPKMPGVHLADVIANNSLVLLNSEPLLDFPRPTAHRVIEIGGIATATKADPLDKYWSDILSRRNRSVILSFGTYVRASTMPEIYKETIRNAMKKFDDVTFIWKYENPAHNVSQGIPNIVETTYMPQVALLNDPRLSAFITHGGQGSTLEAAYSGTPMLMLPTQGDQFRNAAMIKRAGLGEIVQLSDLEGGNRLEIAIHDLLENEQNTIKAKQVASMLKNRPFTAKEKVVRNLEFLAQYGPLRMLDHEGRNMNFISYYLIDVFLFISLVIIFVLGLIGLCCFAGCRCCCRKAHKKYIAIKKRE